MLSTEAAISQQNCSSGDNAATTPWGRQLPSRHWCGSLDTTARNLTLMLLETECFCCCPCHKDSSSACFFGSPTSFYLFIFSFKILLNFYFLHVFLFCNPTLGEKVTSFWFKGWPRYVSLAKTFSVYSLSVFLCPLPPMVYKLISPSILSYLWRRMGER